MRRKMFSLFCVCLIGCFSPVLAQRPGGNQRGPGGNQGGRDASVFPSGTMLPKVKLLDDQGNEFSTTSLRGNYSVLVFGCLT